jgi:hypothetical protein
MDYLDQFGSDIVLCIKVVGLEKGAHLEKIMKTCIKLFLIFSFCFCGTALAQTDQKALLGEWVGKIKITETASLNIVFRYEVDKDGKYSAFLDSPDQGAKGIPVADVVFDGKQVSFKVPAVQGEYAGQLGNDTITGTWKQGGMGTALAFTKGTYQAPANQVDLSADAMKLLLGRWMGKVGPLSVVVRFEQNADGNAVVLLDSPDQGARGIPVTKAALKDGTLSLSISAVGGEYTGKFNGNTIDGTWTQLGNSTPLNLTKDK